MLKCLAVLTFIQFAVSDIVVWDYYLDYCFSQIPAVERPKTRCENLPDLTVERHYLNDFYFWCLAVNNSANIYTELIVEMNEPQIFNDTTKNIEFLQTLQINTVNRILQYFNSILINIKTKYWFLICLRNYDKGTKIDTPKGLKFEYKLTPNYFVAGLRLTNPEAKEYPIDRIVSLKIDGKEACNASRHKELDTIFPLRERPTPIKNRFITHCLELNLERANPEPGFCENVDEVIVRRLVLNKIIPFWCVTVNAARDTNITIEVDGNNNLLAYTDESNPTLLFSVKGKYILNTASRIVIAVQPEILVLPVLNITSLRINDLESCGIVLEQTACGEPQFSFQSLIANGEHVRPGQYPWHAAILEKQNGSLPKYICGGSIIGKNVVITAGHCVSGIDGVTIPKALLVKTGHNNLFRRTKFTQKIQVSKIIVHEEFDINYLEHDIAILKLNKFLEYSDFVQPICLAQNGGPYKHITGIVPGWGRNEKQEKQNLLSAASLPLIDSKTCRRSNRSFFQQFLNDWKFCAGYRNGTSVCTGDSGGGFAVKFPRRWYLRGIVSLGVTEEGLCALEEYVLFTDVAQYYRWIKSKLIL